MPYTSQAETTHNNVFQNLLNVKSINQNQFRSFLQVQLQQYPHV